VKASASPQGAQQSRLAGEQTERVPHPFRRPHRGMGGKARTSCGRKASVRRTAGARRERMTIATGETRGTTPADKTAVPDGPA